MLTGLLIAFAFITFGTHIWMVILGFRKSILWGFLIFLFAPITTIIFAAKNWDEAKGPFLAFAASFCIYIGLITYKAVQFVGDVGEMAREFEQQGDKAGQEKYIAKKMLEAMEKMHQSGMVGREELERARQEYDAKYGEPRQVETPKPVPTPAQKPQVAAVDKADQPPAQQPKASSEVKPAPVPDQSSPPAQKLVPAQQAAVAQPESTPTAPAEEVETPQETAEVQEEGPAIDIDKAMEKIGDKEKKGPSEPRIIKRKVSLSVAKYHIGKKVNIVDVRGRSHRGILKAVHPDRIVIEKVKGIIYSYDLPISGIKTFEVEELVGGS